MEREKAKFDVLKRIEEERLSRGWSEYLLAENSGISQSTISTWRRLNLQPNIASIEKICAGLGITLSQFFQTSEAVCLSDEEKQILKAFSSLSPNQRKAVLNMLNSFS